MTSSSLPEHWHADPLAIGSALNELLRTTEQITAATGEDPVPVNLSAVNVRNRTFRFRPYGGVHDFNRLKGATELHFRGSAYGAQIEYPVTSSTRIITPEDDDTLDAPVYECDFPAQLYRLQRREYFRVRVAPPNTRIATWSRSTGETLRLRIQDVSLSGVGVRSGMSADTLPKPGDVLRNVEFDFNELGSMRASIRVIATRMVSEYDMQQGVKDLVNLGCEFTESDPKRDTFLQKLVFQIDRSTRFK